jgi:hypothetical protein
MEEANIVTSPGRLWDTPSSPATSGIMLSLCEESNAPVAQLDRAADFESVGRGFESLRARQLKLLEASAAVPAALTPVVNDVIRRIAERGVVGPMHRDALNLGPITAGAQLAMGALPP